MEKLKIISITVGIMVLSGLILSYMQESNAKKIEEQTQLANDSLTVKKAVENKIPKSPDNNLYHKIPGNSALRVEPVETTRQSQPRRKQTDSGDFEQPAGSGTARTKVTPEINMSSKTPDNMIKEIENMDKLKNE